MDGWCFSLFLFAALHNGLKLNIQKEMKISKNNSIVFVLRNVFICLHRNMETEREIEKGREHTIDNNLNNICELCDHVRPILMK